MRWALAAMTSVGVLAGCDRLFKLDSFPDAYRGSTGDGVSGDAMKIPPCTPTSFTGATTYTLFGGTSSVSSLTVNSDGTLFVVEIKGSPNALFVRQATTTPGTPVTPPQQNDEMTEPTLDPEAQVMYARDVTAGDMVIAYARSGDTFIPDASLSIPTGHRPGNQTLDLGDGKRRMTVQFDPGNAMYVFNEYEGAPATGWTFIGTTTSVELTGSTATIQDPALGVDGLNMVYTVNNDVYYSHRDAITKSWGLGTMLLAGSFSSPVLGPSCRTLYVVDKTVQKGIRYQNP